MAGSELRQVTIIVLIRGANNVTVCIRYRLVAGSVCINVCLCQYNVLSIDKMHVYNILAACFLSLFE